MALEKGSGVENPIVRLNKQLRRLGCVPRGPIGDVRHCVRKALVEEGPDEDSHLSEECFGPLTLPRDDEV